MNLRWLPSLENIAPADWNALAEPDFPFTRHAFLRALETSESVGVEAGWRPRHLTAWDGETLVGAVFAYDKNHSYGEYIFDWAWAQAYERHQMAYYPKLVAAVPMTPATGRRILLHPNAQAGTRRRLIAEMVRAAPESHWSSIHFLFCLEEEMEDLEAEGFLRRHSFQFHWRNRNYTDFDSFLADFKSRKRKQIVQERSQVAQIPVSILSGDSLRPEHASVFYPFYLDTCEKKSAFPYLRRAFFESLFAEQKQDVVLFLAGEPGKWVAASLCLRAGKHLYGRYWGCTEDIDGLHFELCYYKPIEYAIRNGLTLFEAGAQGEHKIARGFLPEITLSAHWIAHPGFKEGIAQFLTAERSSLADGLEKFSQSPFKSSLGHRGL